MAPDLKLDDITAAIIGAAIKVHRRLGPGLLESAYRVCVAYELGKLGLRVKRLRSHFQAAHSYHTSTRNRPHAGAVEPAIERFCAARIRETSSWDHFRRPTLISVPTMLRTML